MQRVPYRAERQYLPKEQAFSIEFFQNNPRAMIANKTSYSDRLRGSKAPSYLSIMTLRKARADELPVIWNILQQAIAQRKQDGSKQWQNGYPNEQTVRDDMDNDCAYVLEEAGNIIAYAAIIFGIEAAYNDIEGRWL